MFHKPALLIKDPELIKQILVKDFNSFVNHVGGSDDHDPIGRDNLFLSKDGLWRNLRKKLTPFFTSGKMKSMFPFLDKIGDNLLDHMEKMSLNKNCVEMKVKEKLSLFTTDVIASVAFGVDANGLNNPKSEFAYISKKIFDFTLWRGFEFTALFLLPEISKLFNFKMFTKEGTEFMAKTITHVMNEREKSKVHRNDLIDTLIEIKNSEMRNNDEKPLEIETLISQAAVFFSAGHETSSGAATFVLYEIAKREDIQERVRVELQEALMKNDGKLTYDIVMNDTPYLHQVFLEVLRIYPTLPFLDRECSNPNGYSLKPYSDFVIPYKMPILIPIYGIQRDEKYFEDPLKFDPERFSPDNIHKISTFTNLPFGTGNRSCIGERFGLMQSKTAVIKILMNYRVEMADETPKEIRLAKNALVIQSEVPIVLRFVKDELVK
ncbi:probable cytochrome P450 6g2 [Chironomus tepperi]|uniref:probable cytochrome P450 6g2 n=1 Tax=Chironomus tepperi TaxID=113505 RepID=UPI00391F08FA